MSVLKDDYNPESSIWKRFNIFSQYYKFLCSTWSSVDLISTSRGTFLTNDGNPRVSWWKHVKRLRTLKTRGGLVDLALASIKSQYYLLLIECCRSIELRLHISFDQWRSVENVIQGLYWTKWRSTVSIVENSFRFAYPLMISTDGRGSNSNMTGYIFISSMHWKRVIDLTKGTVSLELFVIDWYSFWPSSREGILLLWEDVVGTWSQRPIFPEDVCFKLYATSTIISRITLVFIGCPSEREVLFAITV